MGVCPKCLESIDTLICYSRAYQDFYLSAYEDFEYGSSEILDDGKGEYECPNCGKIITRSEDKAKKILLKKMTKKMAVKKMLLQKDVIK